MSSFSPRELSCYVGDAGIILQKHVQVHIMDRIHRNERIPKSIGTVVIYLTHLIHHVPKGFPGETFLMHSNLRDAM